MSSYTPGEWGKALETQTPNIGDWMLWSNGVVEAYDKLSATSRARTSPSGMLQLYLLYSYGVATMDRPSFGAVGAEGRHFLRLSIANSLEQLQEGVRRIRTAATDRAGFERFLRTEKLWV